MWRYLIIYICSVLHSLQSARCLDIQTNVRSLPITFQSLPPTPYRPITTLPEEKKTRSIANPSFVTARRRMLASVTGSIVPILLAKPQISNGIDLNLFRDDRRQLELCIVTVLRTQCWAMRISQSMQASLQSHDSDATRDHYMEARLGSKALLTGKLSAGSNYNVYKLAPFQLRGCLKDSLSHCRDSEKVYIKQSYNKKDPKAAASLNRMCNARQTEDVAQDLVESFASCLEFDGLDNLEDQSPRSSLMITQFTEEKARFVLRMLTERSIPKCTQYLDLIYSTSDEPAELKSKCLDYLQRNYGAEIPVDLIAQV